MDVAFHLNVPAAWPQRSAYLCRLLAKAYEAGVRVWVVVAPDEVTALDQALWTLPADDFVPHVCADAPPVLRRRAPIVIAAPTDTVEGERPVLVNAQPQWPAVLDAPRGWARVVEVVSTDEDDKAAARQRWRRYQAMGCTLVAHDRLRRAASAPAEAPS
jgi:DNA polymerase-3 subunit chi